MVLIDRVLPEARYTGGALPEVCGHTFYCAPLNEQSVVVDLGGSLGFFSHALSDLKNCTCHVVEATSGNFQGMELSKGMFKYHHAITGADGPVDFLIPEGEDYHWGLLAEPGDIPVGTTEMVPGITLESFLEARNIDRIDLLKVDIEGAEIDMFDSTSDQTLRAIGQITIEFHDFIAPKMASDVERIKARLSGLGFACIVFTRHFHGDVLFINRDLVTLSNWRLMMLAGPIKYLRGLRRIIDRIK